MNKETFLKIAKSVCAYSPDEEAYYTISDVVDLWDNHREEALTVLAYRYRLKDTMDSYKSIKIVCGDYAWVEKNILPRVAKYIVSFAKRNSAFVNGLKRWNDEYGKCFLNEF